MSEWPEELFWWCGDEDEICSDAWEYVDEGEILVQGDLGIGTPSDSIPNACRADCRLPACGDGVIDASESCDDGDANSDTTPDACRTTCLLAKCGDGVVDSGEACDLGAGNANLPDTCRLSCALPRCGDGIFDGGEQCDDGNLNDADLCGNDCRLNLGDCLPTDPLCGA